MRSAQLKAVFLCGFFVFGASCKAGRVENEKSAQEVGSQKTHTAASLPAESVNVMTFNILWDKQTSGPTQWSSRRESMANLIKRHHPDVIGIQEGFINQVDYLKSEIGYEYFGWGTDDGKDHLKNPGRAQSLNPIMYNPARLIMLDKGVFWYGEKTDAPAKYGTDTHFRNCVWGKFRENTAEGKTFYVFNTHFSLSDDIRQKQADFLKTKIRQIAGEAAQVIITGDFNADPVRDLSYNSLVNTTRNMPLVHARKISSTVPDGPLFSGSGLKVNSRSFGFEVDHIFLRNIHHCTAYKVIADYEGSYYPSDHFPVLAVLNLKDNL